MFLNLVAIVEIPDLPGGVAVAIMGLTFELQTHLKRYSLIKPKWFIIFIMILTI